jgi:hypothetical protein
MFAGDIMETDGGADSFDDRDSGIGAGLTEGLQYFTQYNHADGDGCPDGITEVWFDEDVFGVVGGCWGLVDE